MGKKGMIAVVIVVVAVIVAVAWYLLSSKDQDNVSSENHSSQTGEEMDSQEADEMSDEEEVLDENVENQGKGRYATYEADQIGEEGYDTTVLFFYASWCPDCQAFDTAIVEGEIPSGTQILKVDYDSNKDLRKQYGVTVQSTFIGVDNKGEKKSSWIGSGEASLEAVLENTQ